MGLPVILLCGHLHTVTCHSITDGMIRCKLNPGDMGKLSSAVFSESANPCLTLQAELLRSQ